ncbi:MAG: hypothetical protein IPI00_15060 [Flavobacteriales bacterium]|nr:hypothetical protein [Flavobacteriales bacterium]MBK6945333.1 hypothetical protein [Flavobacteriales bacterium]MBK7241445.1 hypothetical protein [Flavobacteriales bacterium]MBK7298260.1 hypothetical protein [Flavobacteriales bacterium]MBK9535109.1 hypothetical protein [Flavobacteriales bacterium]
MMRITAQLFFLLFSTACFAQWTFTGNSTPTWQEVIERYTELDAQHTGAKLVEIGHDDDGSPIHLFILADGSGFTPDSIRAAGKNILWITNGIHPGEPDGIDASLLLVQALLDSDQYMGLLSNTAVCIVPVFNVSGAKNRSSTSRANQNGPEEYGFRGNARNLDLNRDFMKTDSRNARSLISAMSAWDPDVYFETHVSNGADHQYVMELFTTHPDKLDPALSNFLQRTMIPRQNAWMEQRGVLMCPFFETEGRTPEDGLKSFVDGPRYSTGHAALRNRIGILSESHMLKPYSDRVNATFQLMLGTLAVMNENPEALALARIQAFNNTITTKQFEFNWELDTTHLTVLPWLGYEAIESKSDVSGLPRITYDHDRPTSVDVPWTAHAKPTITLEKPVGYLIPQAWTDVIDRLALENVVMEVVGDQRKMNGEVHYILNYKTVKTPYEGHYLHYDISTRVQKEEVTARTGDVYVPMGNYTDRLVMELLEPRASDGFFAWNFLDAILQQKEWFSDYVFEDIATDLLAKDPFLKAELVAACAADPKLANDAWGQLYFVYQRSPYFESSYMRYPVVRCLN